MAGTGRIAEKFFDGYHNALARGGLQGVFDPIDVVEEWVFASPFLGGEMRPGRDGGLALGADANHKAIWQRVPDYRMDDLDVWPSVDGCAWRWRVHGRGIDGKDYEFWEQLFVRLDGSGRVTRFEFFDDWHGFPQTLAFAYGQTLDAVTRTKDYGRPPWTPPPRTTFSAGPGLAPTYSARALQNLSIAEKFYDGYHHSVDRGHLGGAWDKAHFADGWVLFSPWAGELTMPADWDWSTVGNAEHKRIWQRLPDYKMDQFDAWPTDDGCAWRWCVNGHSQAGDYYEFWEQCFFRTNDEGLITRFEFYDDWCGFPQTLGFITGLTLEQLWTPDKYRAWAAGSQDTPAVAAAQ